MPTKLELGRLEQIRLRDAWENEASDFTPWLATPDNISLLSQAIGIDLEVEATEQQVGPFRADIVCRNLADQDSLVLIENQIERTDHTHLGQLLTYAAGLEAVTVVWVAERFQIEHRAAIDWLNAITQPKFNFFGLEVELWRIGNSPAAPKFNIVCQPNEWVRTAGQTLANAEALTPTRQLQQEFWVEFKRFLVESGSPLRTSTPGPRAALSVALGRSGFVLWAVNTSYNPIDATTYEPALRAQLTIEHPEAAGLFRALMAQKDAIERQLAEPLVWMTVDDAQKRRRAFLWTPANIENRSNWSSQHRWLKEKLELLHRVFAPIVRDLQPIQAGQAVELA